MITWVRRRPANGIDRTAHRGGERREYEFPVGFPAQALRHDFVPALWAQKKVLALLDQIRLHGAQQELLDEVTRLSREFGIATPYTSHPILEEDMRLGAQYRGPADSVPPSPGGGRGMGGLAGPTTRGPAGPGTAGPGGLGPTTGLAGSTLVEEDLRGQIERQKQRLAQGRWPTTGAEAVQDSVQTGSDEFFLGATKLVGLMGGPPRQLPRPTIHPIPHPRRHGGLHRAWARPAERRVATGQGERPARHLRRSPCCDP